MNSLALLSEVSQNINHHLPQIQCLAHQNYNGQSFLRLFSTVYDENLCFTPAVEIVVTCKNSEELNLTLVSYKREVLEETTFRYCDQDSATGLHTYMLYVQKMLCQTEFVMCQGTAEGKIFTQFTKIRKSDLILCLIEKSVINSGELVFRARQCRTVYPRIDVDQDTGLCEECAHLFSIICQDREEETEEDNAQEDAVKICPFSSCGKTFRRNKPWENHLKSHSKDDNQDVQKNDNKKTKRKRMKSYDISTLHSEVKCEPDIYSEIEQSSPMKKVNLEGSYENPKKRFQCTICSNSYLYEKAFENHMKSHEASIPEQISSDSHCEICNKVFEKGSEFNEHMNMDHKNYLSCDACPMKFTFRKLYEEHQSELHSHTSCVPCDIIFDCADSFQSHNLEHHDVNGDPCHICGKHVKRSSMANHVKMVHHSEEMRKHLCNICGNAYKTKTDLDRHYTKHTGKFFKWSVILIPAYYTNALFIE